MTEQPPFPSPTQHRVRLTARAPIGDCLVGCTGAKIDPETDDPHAALAITDGDGSRQLLEVVADEEIPLRSGLLVVDQIHPWDPPHPAGVSLTWVPRAHDVDAAATTN